MYALVFMLNIKTQLVTTSDSWCCSSLLVYL